MTLEQIKTEAVQANDILIQWDKLNEDENYRKDFVQSLELVVNGIPGLEYIYTMVSSGNTTLPGMEQDEVIDTCADELFAAYQLADVYHRYKMISEITV